VKKKEKNRRGKRAIVVCKGKIFFPEREIQEEEEEKEKKNRKECEHTSGPGSHKSVSNDDAMLMNSSIVDDNFLCVLFFPFHHILLTATGFAAVTTAFAFL